MAENKLTEAFGGDDMTGVAAIAEALKVNKTLQSIEYAAKIQTSLVDGCEHFTPSAPTDAKSLVCSVADNYFMAEGAKFFADMLKVNQTLQSVKYAASCPALSVNLPPESNIPLGVNVSHRQGPLTLVHDLQYDTGA